MLVIISVASLSSGGLEVCVQRPQHHANAFRIYHSSEQIRATLLKFGISSRFFRVPFCPPPFAGNSAEQTVRTPIVSGFCSDQANGSPPTSENARTTLQDNKMFTPHLSRSEFRRRKKAFWPPTSKLEAH